MAQVHIVFIGAGILSLVSVKRLLDRLGSNRSDYKIIVLEKHQQGAVGTTYGNGGSLTAIEGLSALKSGSTALTTLHPSISGNVSDQGWLLDHFNNLPSSTKTWIQQASKILDPNLLPLYNQSAKYLTQLGESSIEYIAQFFRENPRLAIESCFQYFSLTEGQFTCRYTDDELYSHHHTFLKILGLIPHLNLNSKTLPLAGGCINARAFALALIDQLYHAGVEFRFNSNISSLCPKKITLSTGEIVAADKIIISTGCDVSIFKTLGITIPITPIGGCTLTVPLPKGVTPETLRPFKLITPQGSLVFSPFFGPQNNYLRIAGISWLDPSITTDPTSPQARYGFDTLKHYLHSLFPDIYHYAQNSGEWSPWVGFRPYTPDFLPIIGEVRPRSDIWINMGHGPGGTAYSFGAADLLLQQVFPNLPYITTSLKPEVFSLDRFN